MSKITVYVPPPLRPDSGGQRELILSAATVQAALTVLERDYASLHRGICDDTGTVRRNVNLFVNDDHIRERQGLDTPLADGDTLTIMPAVSGG